ncbi:MAG TPA: DUF6159 family protein [Ginsengibacter sp.]
MSFFDRLSNGWQISMNSFKVLKENKQLIIFPILSGLSLLMIIGSFVIVALAGAGWDFSNVSKPDSLESYAVIFLFYIINYFIVVYFNTALIHCTTLYFKGEEVTVRKGLDFSFSRIGAIFSWALFAGTVGTILKIIQDSVGSLGKIITGLIGVVWSIATFFVVPVIAYENLGPIGAFKRSMQLMKQKWGESLSAGFSFGLIQFLGIIMIALFAFLGALIHPVVGIVIGVLGISLLLAVISAAQSIFISAVYHNINGDPVKQYNQQFIDNLFTKK